jgi:hypothetical protein
MPQDTNQREEEGNKGVLSGKYAHSEVDQEYRHRYFETLERAEGYGYNPGEVLLSQRPKVSLAF